MFNHCCCPLPDRRTNSCQVVSFMLHRFTVQRQQCGQHLIDRNSTGRVDNRSLDVAAHVAATLGSTGIQLTREKLNQEKQERRQARDEKSVFLFLFLSCPSFDFEKRMDRLEYEQPIPAKIVNMIHGFCTVQHDCWRPLIQFDCTLYSVLKEAKLLFKFFFIFCLHYQNILLSLHSFSILNFCSPVGPNCIPQPKIDFKMTKTFLSYVGQADFFFLLLLPQTISGNQNNISFLVFVFPYLARHCKV